MAVEEGARSVDHLSLLHPDDVGLLARSECAAVLLPGAEFMNAEHAAPGRALADAGRHRRAGDRPQPGHLADPVAARVVGLGGRGATAGPRSRRCSPRRSTRPGCSAGTTRWARVEVGKRADLVLLDGPLTHVPYRFGRNPVAVVVGGGEVAWVRPGEERRVGRVAGSPAGGRLWHALAPWR